MGFGEAARSPEDNYPISLESTQYGTDLKGGSRSYLVVNL